MSGIKKIVFILIIGMILIACKTVNIPDAYNFRITQSEVNPYGCWTILALNPAIDSMSQNLIQGELIFMDSVSTYLLESDYHVFQVNNGRIIDAKLVTHKNQAQTYAITTSLFLVPNIIGAIALNPAFLALGIPVAVVGYSHALIEGASERNILKYPQKNKLESFRIFARFPGGIPGNIDLNKLTLKKPDK